MMDFRTLHKIGDKIDEPFRAIIEGIGYDNNYCLCDKKLGELTQAAVLYDEASGRQMQVYTDLVGIQVYCGGWLAKDGNPGKGDSKVSSILILLIIPISRLSLLSQTRNLRQQRNLDFR